MTSGAIATPSTPPPTATRPHCDQQFADDTAARRAKRQAQRGFPPARESAREKQVRDVQTRQQKNQRRRSEEDEKRPLQAPAQIGSSARGRQNSSDDAR